MLEQGCYFQESLSGTLSLSRTNAFFLGGGTLNAYYNERLRWLFLPRDILDVVIRDRKFDGVLVDLDGTQSYKRSRCVILASGGFGLRTGWRALGDAAGTPNPRTPITGEVLKGVLAGGADQVESDVPCGGDRRMRSQSTMAVARVNWYHFDRG